MEIKKAIETVEKKTGIMIYPYSAVRKPPRTFTRVLTARARSISIKYTAASRRIPLRQILCCITGENSILRLQDGLPGISLGPMIFHRFVPTAQMFPLL